MVHFNVQSITENGQDASEAVKEFFETHDCSNYEAVKKMLFIKLSPKPVDGLYIKSIPHRDFIDLMLSYTAVLFFGNDEEGERNITDFTITNEMLDMWGITEADLFADAFANTCRMFPATIDTIEDVLHLADEDDPDQKTFYIMSNAARMYGANTLLYENDLHKFAEEHGDFYIIPSSKHEILLIPESLEIPADELRAMLVDVNLTVVKPQDRLCDTLYHYSIDSGVRAVVFEEK